MGALHSVLCNCSPPRLHLVSTTAPPRCSVSCSLTLRGQARGSPYAAIRVPRVVRVVGEPCRGQEDSARSTSGCSPLGARAPWAERGGGGAGGGTMVLLPQAAPALGLGLK